MNKPWLLALAVLMCSVAAAEEGRRNPVVPQPRVRLDPNTRAAIPARPTDPQTKSDRSAVVMSPFVVKSTAIPVEGPEEPAPSDAPFSLLVGGRIWKKDTGGRRVEFGVWPYRNILWKSDKFKSDLNHVGTELVRVSW